jgi:hypothetical protein
MNDDRMPFLPVYPSEVKSIDLELALDKRLSGKQFPHPSHADKKLSEIILKACAFGPAERYKTPTEIHEALAAYISSVEPSILEQILFNSTKPEAKLEAESMQKTELSKAEPVSTIMEEKTEMNTPIKRIIAVIGAVCIVFIIFISIVMFKTPRSTTKVTSIAPTLLSSPTLVAVETSESATSTTEPSSTPTIHSTETPIPVATPIMVVQTKKPNIKNSPSQKQQVNNKTQRKPKANTPKSRPTNTKKPSPKPTATPSGWSVSRPH